MMAEVTDRKTDEFRTPGSRYDRMLGLIERGACEEEFADEIEGGDIAVYRCISAIVNGTISKGGLSSSQIAKAVRGREAQRQKREEVFRMLDEGLSSRVIAERADIKLDYVYRIRSMWAAARGLNRKRVNYRWTE